MKKKAQKFAHDSMLPKMTIEDVFWVVMEEHKVAKKQASDEDQRIEGNIGIIDEQFLELQEMIGRELTEDEQSEVLDIVDEYTPKDKDGNYLCSLLPFDYAWEIYEVQKRGE
jgi:predicted RNA-binding protein